jgi:formamidopyrimidine-DNA glycosylase
MPELPELEVVKEVLLRRVVGQQIVAVDVIGGGGAIVTRDLTFGGFAKTLAGATITNVERRGKFIIFSLRPQYASRTPTADDSLPLYLVMNPKLTGRLQLVAEKLKPMTKRQALHSKIHFILSLANGEELRYVDDRTMGQLYLTHNLTQVPDFAGMGPEPLEISLDDFRARLRPFRGEIKGILTRGDFIAGIGNAYADEILWAARIHPYRKRAQLTAEEIERLHNAMRDTLIDATDQVRVEMGEDIHTKPRDFMAVHMQSGAACPRCGTPISLVGANQRITNFCRNCQPGGLIKGM